MRAIKYALLSAVLTAALFFYTAAEAQNAEYNALRISWPANPAEENVEWYVLSYLQNDVWVKLIDTSQTSYTASFSEIAGGLKIGDNICFMLIAAAGNERSQPSESTCVDVPSVNQEPAQPSSLSKPGNPDVQLITR